MNIVEEIRTRQNQLIMTINTTFEEIIRKVETLNHETAYENEYESIYPICNYQTFKGKKPIAVIFNNQRIIASTWKSVVEIILKEVSKDENMKTKMMSLRERLLGRVRNKLSTTSAGMTSPIKLCKDLYIETHYDTRMLMGLMIQILEEIKYDYSNIYVVIKN